MDEKKIAVLLTGPAKVDGMREPAGKRLNVTPAVALQLAANGVIAPPAQPFDDSTMLESDFETAVEKAVAERTAEILATAEARMLEHAEDCARTLEVTEKRIEEAAAQIVSFDEASRAAVTRAEAAEAKVAELEADLAEAKAKSNTSPADPKPAGKKT